MGREGFTAVDNAATGGPRPPGILPPLADGDPAATPRRLAPLDLLRGVAVCGILLMNIVDFGWPGDAYFRVAAPYYALDSIGPVDDPDEVDARIARDDEGISWVERERRRLARQREQPRFPTGEIRFGAVSADADRVEFVLAEIVVANKMRGLLSMLFGAGVVLSTAAVAARGARAGRWHYRRMFWLAVIGAAHCYLLWEGDILLGYAAAGLWLYPLRNVGARALAAVALGLVAAQVVIAWFLVPAIEWVDRRGAAVEARLVEMVARADAAAHGADAFAPGDDDLSTADEFVLEFHRQSTAQRHDRQRPELTTLAIRRRQNQGYAAGVVERFTSMIGAQAGELLFGIVLWGTPMILGMALVKNGFLGGEWSDTAYRRWAVAGYAIGVPLAWAAVMISLRGGVAFATYLRVVVPLELVATLALVCAHAGAVLWAWRGGAFGSLGPRLEAVGAMALSNYLSQSLICSLLFFGHGLALAGTVPRTGLVVIAVMIWALQLAWSPWWLARFRLGPAEWLWRSLTAWSWQPFLREHR